MADPTFDNIYVGSGYDAAVTVPSGLSASHLVAFVAAFGSSTDSITMSGWTQEDIRGASGGGETVRQAVFTRAYAAGTYSPTLGGALNSYEITIYAVNDFGAVDAVASEAADNENPASWSLGPTIASNGSLVIACITCWGDCPKPTDITGTWTSYLGPPTLSSPSLSEQRTWYNTQNAGTASFAVTKTFENPDTGVATLIIISPAGGAISASVSFTAAAATFAATADVDVSGTAAFSAPVATFEATADVDVSATAEFTAPVATFSCDIEHESTISASVSFTAPAATFECTADIDVSMSAAFVSAPATFACTADVDISATATFVAVPATFAATADVDISASTAFSSPPATFSCTVGTGRTMVVAGNSIVYGTYSGGQSIYGWSTSDVNGLGGRLDIPLAAASGGYDTAYFITNFSTVLEPLLGPGVDCVYLELINTIWNGGANASGTNPTPREAVDELWVLADLITATGARLIMCTCTPVDDVIQPYLSTACGLVRSEWPSYADGMFDAFAIADFYPPGTSNANYNDDTHLTGNSLTLGYGVLTTDFIDYYEQFLTENNASCSFSAPAATFACAADIDVSASAAFTAPPATFACTVFHEGAITVSFDAPPATFEATADVDISATAAFSSPPATFATTVGVLDSISASFTSPAATFACDISSPLACSVAFIAPVATFQAVADVDDSTFVAVAFTSPAATFAASITSDIAIAGAFASPPATFACAVGSDVSAAVAFTSPAATFSCNVIHLADVTVDVNFTAPAARFSCTVSSRLSAPTPNTSLGRIATTDGTSLV